MRLRTLAGKCKEADAETKELRNRRQKLMIRLEKWRKEQKLFSPQVRHHIANDSASVAEDMCLFLPSNFYAPDRTKLDLVSLGSKQATLVEAALSETITTLQTTVKSLSAAYERKIKHARGQEANTRSTGQINTILAKRDELIGEYNSLRRMLADLDGLDEMQWPKLEPKDTYRRPTESRRKPGHSHEMEGNLWSMSSAGYTQQSGAGVIFGDTDPLEDVDTDSEDEESECALNDAKYFGTCLRHSGGYAQQLMLSQVHACQNAKLARLHINALRLLLLPKFLRRTWMSRQV